MFGNSEQFLIVWAEESAITDHVLRNVSEGVSGYRPTAGGRSIGDVVWHLTTSVVEIGARAGLNLKGPRSDASPPETIAAMAEVFSAVAPQVGREIADWTEDAWSEEVEVYGDQWTRGRTVYVLVAHLIHHRGQLTAMLRAAGGEVPATYGPSADEYAPGRPRRSEPSN